MTLEYIVGYHEKGADGNVEFIQVDKVELKVKVHIDDIADYFLGQIPESLSLEESKTYWLGAKNAILHAFKQGCIVNVLDCDSFKEFMKKECLFDAERQYEEEHNCKLTNFNGHDCSLS